jgi:hypothetical protein
VIGDRRDAGKLRASLSRNNPSTRANVASDGRVHSARRLFDGLHCGGQYESIRAVKYATVPAGDAAPALDPPVRDGGSLLFTWKFNSHFDPAAYLEWATNQMSKRGFTIQRRERSSIEVTKVGPESGAALATVVGVLIEVPVMLSVCSVCNRTRNWFPAPVNAH